MTRDHRSKSATALASDRPRSIHDWFAIVMALAAITSVAIGATPQKNRCDGVIPALGKAQGEYNKARSARIKAEGDLNRARNNLKTIADRIKTNETQQSKAEAVLDQLKEEQARCENANGELAPLSGNCTTVQARIDKANKDIANLRAEHGRMVDQQTAAEMDVERNERELAAKQTAEAAAQAVLDQAKKDAAGCRRAA